MSGYYFEKASFGSGTFCQGFSLFLAENGVSLLASVRATVWSGKGKFIYAYAGDRYDVEMGIYDFLAAYPGRSAEMVFRSWIIQDPTDGEWIGEIREEAGEFLVLGAETAEDFERFCFRCLTKLAAKREALRIARGVAEAAPDHRRPRGI